MTAGTEILSYRQMHLAPELYYWQRMERGSMAEVDYLIDVDGKVVPVEVKAGERGGMKSLYFFMEQRNLSRGIRCSLENSGQIQRERETIESFPSTLSQIYPKFSINEIYSPPTGGRGRYRLARHLRHCPRL